MKDAAKRGRAFEQLMLEAVAAVASRIKRNPRAARPRQTDLIAVIHGTTYLIEVKWRKAAVGIPEIDSLRSRLSRTPADFIGVLFSMSNYAESAKGEVSNHRQREILLFSDSEVESIVDDPTALSDLLEQKRRALREEGAVWFDDTSLGEEPLLDVKLPSAGERIIGSTDPSWCCRNREHFTALYSRTSLGLGESGASGAHVALRLNLSLHTTRDLHRTFQVLHSHLRLSGLGSFSITQTSHAWHGVGVDNLLAAVDSMDKRVACLPKSSKLHHSEEIAYFESTGSMRLLLETRQNTMRGLHNLHGSSLEVHLPGVPADLGRYQRMCLMLGSSDAVFLQAAEAVRAATVSLPLEHLANINSSPGKGRSDWDIARTGIIARNPLYRKSRPRGIDASEVVWSLSYPEHLVCDLRDWVGPDDEVDRYHLTRIDVLAMGDYSVVHPVCTWGEITSERCPPVGLEEALKPLHEALDGDSASE